MSQESLACQRAKRNRRAPKVRTVTARPLALTRVHRHTYTRGAACSETSVAPVFGPLYSPLEGRGWSCPLPYGAALPPAHARKNCRTFFSLHALAIVRMHSRIHAYYITPLPPTGPFSPFSPSSHSPHSPPHRVIRICVDTRQDLGRSTLRDEEVALERAMRVCFVTLKGELLHLPGVCDCSPDLHRLRFTCPHMPSHAHLIPDLHPLRFTCPYMPSHAHLIPGLHPLRFTCHLISGLHPLRFTCLHMPI